MKARTATSQARRTLLRRGRDLLKSVGKVKSGDVDIMDLLSPDQKDQLALIHIALEKIERGRFGVCDCGERIAEDQLLDEPWVLECEDCLGLADLETAAAEEASFH